MPTWADISSYRFVARTVAGTPSRTEPLMTYQYHGQPFPPRRKVSPAKIVGIGCGGLLGVLLGVFVSLAILGGILQAAGLVKPSPTNAAAVKPASAPSGSRPAPSGPRPTPSADAVTVTQSPSKTPAKAAVTTHSVVHVKTTPKPPPPKPPPPPPPPPPVAATCGAPSNPDGLNFCGRGHLVSSPPGDVCSYFSCIPNFWNGTGYMAECNDGMYSMSGGRQGACSHHGGETRPVYEG
jgi:hypothetical protein